MLFDNISYVDKNFELKRGWVATEGNRIVYVGSEPPADMANAGAGASADAATGAKAGAGAIKDYGEIVNGKGKLLIPGMHNAHAHSPMTLLRGYAENLPLSAWLNEKVFPFEAHINDERALPATRLAIAEMLRFGVVAFADMYYFADARAKAAMESGIKLNMSQGIIVFDESLSYDDLPAKSTNEYIFNQYHNANDGQIKIDLCVHTEYTTTERVVRAVGDLAVEFGVNTHIHLSETKSEHEQCKQRRAGKTPAEYFESLGFFRQPCLAAHCVWAEPSDWQIFKEHNVTAVCNPASNMKLGSGFAPVGQMLKAGVNVALGTDGVASNNSHNLLKDVYLLATIYKGFTGDTTNITPAEALYAATRAGALAMGRSDSGLIATGMRADLVMLDTAVPWMQPEHDALNNLVYSAQGTDVMLTMVDGKVCYRNGEWSGIDVQKAIAQTDECAKAILSEL
ncbi:MAG: amidohydrolase [Coriobacteriales bacterium]|jgi:5-methylthioadenosine/S-adenosylhomocysteine deaminase|nr:amidohydrolase [Coriobacteriales bacterium]